MNVATLVAIFVVVWLGSVTTARVANRNAVPAGNFFWFGVAATFLVWRYLLCPSL